MRILVTNDDGVYSPGLLALKQSLSNLGEVVVVAPDRPRSATGHAITLHKPLRIRAVKLPDGSMAHAVNGTPADCVVLGYHIVMEQRCSVVASGINPGANLGWDVNYSGTVAAALEGAILDVPSFAISIVTEVEPDDVDYSLAAGFAVRVARSIEGDSALKRVCLNVNVPEGSRADLRSVAITRQGSQQYENGIDVTKDPAGKPCYWFGGVLLSGESEPGTDVAAIREHRISVTPLGLDLTAHALLPELEDWKLD
ncbi:MAG: 5'/3'-nucleotidase SurE [Armatimonadetes bacterium]|nr:5'/3'-nucleotidase SurE [Armatimonadota bacterium]MDE2206735.1 5'/3'-nucleotidase SurE [Armatimonadota bacterium]